MPQALRATHDKWLRPDNVTIAVVGDVSMEQLKPMLEASFGSWKASASPRPVKALDAARAHTPAEVAEGRLAPIAASILMMILYGARMARLDLLRAVCHMSRFVTKWTPACD